MGSSQKIVKGVAWTMLVNIVNAVYGFISVPILINHFGKAEYGLIGLAMSINVYLQLMDMGFNSTNVRFFSTWLAEKKHDKVSKAFQTSLSFYGTIGLLNALILFALSFFTESIFNVTPNQDVILKHLMYILSISAFCSWFSSCFDQLIKATENVDWIQKRTLFTKILMIIVLFATVYLNFNIEWYYILTCLATLSIVPLSITKIKKELSFVSFLPKLDKETFKEMLPYCLNIFSFSIFQFSFFNLRPVFLGIQGTVESVADYRVLNGVIGVVTLFAGAFMGVLLPSTAKVVAQGNKEAYYKVAYNGTRYISIVTCFCCFGMMSVGPELLTLYVGEEYLYLIPWFNLWLICTLGTHNQAISSLILSGADIRAISYSSVVASIVGLLVSWFLIPFYQIGGTVIGFVIYCIIQLLFYYLYYWPKKMRINSLRVLTTCFMPYVILGGLSFFIISMIDHGFDVWMTFFIKGLTFTILFCLITWLILDKSDKSFLMNIIKKGKK